MGAILAAGLILLAAASPLFCQNAKIGKSDFEFYALTELPRDVGRLKVTANGRQLFFSLAFDTNLAATLVIEDGQGEPGRWPLARRLKKFRMGDFHFMIGPRAGTHQSQSSDPANQQFYGDEAVYMYDLNDRLVGSFPTQQFWHVMYDYATPIGRAEYGYRMTRSRTPKDGAPSLILLRRSEDGEMATRVLTLAQIEDRSEWLMIQSTGRWQGIAYDRRRGGIILFTAPRPKNIKYDLNISVEEVRNALFTN